MTLLEIHEPGQTPQPHEARHSAVGIDLGTTNSLVAVAHDNRPEVLRDGKGGSALVPSVVAYLADGPVLVGEEAKAHLLTDPDRVVSSVKRLMGRGVEDMKALAGTLPFDAEPSPDGVGMIRVNIAGRSLTPVEISAVILADLKGRGERALGHDVTNAVVTVPAYFDDAARAATKDAAKLAGLDVLRLVNEPTAAALAYGLDRAAEGLFAVYDLGGGTFDISILRMQMGVFQVIATGGDAALGGDDFDHAIAEHFLAERNHDGGLTPVEAKLALATARVAKECLTDQERGEWVIKSGGRSSRHILDRAKLETLLVPFVERTLATCRSVLADADLDEEDLCALRGEVAAVGQGRADEVEFEAEAGDEDLTGLVEAVGDDADVVQSGEHAWLQSGFGGGGPERWPDVLLVSRRCRPPGARRAEAGQVRGRRRGSRRSVRP